MKTERLLPEKIVFYLLALFLPTQLGKHFWPDFAFLSGIRIDYLSPTLYVTDCLVLLLFGFYLIRFFTTYKNESGKHILHFIRRTSPFWFTIFVFTLGVLYSAHKANGIYALIKFCEFALLGTYIAYQSGKIISIRTLAVLLSSGVIFESLLGIAQFINQGSLGGILYLLGERTFTAGTPGIANASVYGELIMRPYGTFPHPNVFAGFLLSVMILDIFLLPQIWKRSIGTLFAITMLLGSIGLLISLSRVAILLWFLILAGLTVKQLRRTFLEKRYRVLSITISIIAVIVLAYIFFASPLGGRFLQTSFYDESVVEREILISSAINMIVHAPLLGVGPGNFLPELVLYPQSNTLYTSLQPVHNIYLLVLAETGIFGLWMFGQLLYFLYRNIFSHLRLQREKEYFTSLFFVLTALLVIGNFDHYLFTLQQGQLLFAFIIGFSAVKFVKK